MAPKGKRGAKAVVPPAPNSKAKAKAKSQPGQTVTAFIKKMQDQKDDEQKDEENTNVLALVPAAPAVLPAGPAGSGEGETPAAHGDGGIPSASGKGETPAADDGDYEDGRPDPRPTSRAQMYVFKKFFSELSAEAQQEWATLCQPGGATGKQARKNEIVNAHVPRKTSFKGSLEVKSMTLARVVKLVDTHEKEIEEVHSGNMQNLL